jgi:DNA-binding CsgD family transcriptional regulator
MVPMCEHDPPRLGVVLSAAPPEADLGGDGTLVHPDLIQTALEARASQALSALRPLARFPAASDLSARQIEIVSRLVSGERIVEIAEGMYLSPSTVRNHLTAIYRKFGVHSQAELLAALLRVG